MKSHQSLTSRCSDTLGSDSLTVSGKVEVCASKLRDCGESPENCRSQETDCGFRPKIRGFRLTLDENECTPRYRAIVSYVYSATMARYSGVIFQSYLFGPGSSNESY